MAWLNGKFLGQHDGGYTEFSFDVGAFLNHNASGPEDNQLVVLVDNSWGTRTGYPGRARWTGSITTAFTGA